MQNDNEYDDETFSRYSGELDSAIVTLWEGGASVKDIEGIIANAMENATTRRWTASLYEAG